MYATAAAHFGIVIRGLFEDERQSQALQAVAVSCLSDSDSFAQCPASVAPFYDLPEPGIGKMSLVLDALLAVNVSKIIW